MFFDSFSEGIATELNDPQRNLAGSRNAFAPLNCQPGFPWHLRGDFMELERREQANYTVRNRSCHFDKGLMLGHIVSKGISTTCNAT